MWKPLETCPKIVFFNDFGAFRDLMGVNLVKMVKNKVY